MDNNYSRLRLSPWTVIPVVAGGLLTYCGVGILLTGSRFVPDLMRLLEDPTAFIGDDPQAIASFALLLIPAVLGALATRAMLKIVIGGLRDGDSAMTIAKAIAAYLGGALLLVIAAFFTGDNPRL